MNICEFRGIRIQRANVPQRTYDGTRSFDPLTEIIVAVNAHCDNCNRNLSLPDSGKKFGVPGTFCVMSGSLQLSCYCGNGKTINPTDYP